MFEKLQEFLTNQNATLASLSNNSSSTNIAPLVQGDIMKVIITFIVIFFIILLVYYIYQAFVWSTIARKLKYKRPWLAWIPIANGAMILQLGGFHWAWIFLILIPILGWIALGVLVIISIWKIFEKRNYPGWLSLIPILGFVPYVGYLANLANLVIMGFVAWADRK